jgi:hypothetical protein
VAPQTQFLKRFGAQPIDPDILKLYNSGLLFYIFKISEKQPHPQNPSKTSTTAKISKFQTLRRDFSRLLQVREYLLGIVRASEPNNKKM